MEVKDIDDFLIDIQDFPVDLEDYYIHIIDVDGAREGVKVKCQNCKEVMWAEKIELKEISMDGSFQSHLSHKIYEENLNKYCSKKCGVVDKL